MKQKLAIILWGLALLLFINNVFAYNQKDYEKAKKGLDLLAFSVLDLSHADLSGANLSCVSFSGASLWSTNFRNAILWHTNFSYSNLEGASFDGAEVKGADFKNTTGLTSAQKKYLRENGAINVPPDIDENSQQNLEPGYLILLIQKIFNVSKKQSLKLYHWLRCKDLTDKNLENQNLTKHYLIGAILRRTNLRNADLSNQKLKGINLEDAIVEGANFAHVKDLTNEQKQFLREHGARNVPVEIVYELDN